MRNRVMILVAAMALLISACGNSTESTSKKMKVDGGELVLGQYKGLAVNKTTYKVSDNDVDGEIESMLEEYMEYNVVSRKAEEGDYVSFDLKGTENGKEIEEYTGEGYGAYVGQEDFGSEFDQQLLGVKAGEEKKFTITYDKDDPDEVLAGKTVDFEMKVIDVEEEVYPELTDEFVQDKLEYKNEETLRAEVRERLETDSKDNAVSTMKDDALQQVISNSKFEKYSDQVYQQCKEEVEAEYMGYAEWFGYSDVQDVYEAFGMTEDAVEEEIMNLIHTRLVVEAIAQVEEIKVSNQEYEEALPNFASMLGYENVDDLISDYGKDALSFWILQGKVENLIVENATVTEIETEQVEESDISDLEEEVK